MAGHSKWAQIKRKKAVTDARRGKLWSKLLKEVSVAARIGGGDPAGGRPARSLRVLVPGTYVLRSREPQRTFARSGRHVSLVGTCTAGGAVI